jgi:ribosomal protein L11 methyltransferase
MPFAIPPRWWLTETATCVPDPDLAPSHRLTLVLLPGPGFGDGTHPTTYLCLQALAALAPRAESFQMLDFGSGSGVLSIGAALLGATVDAVEIDPHAIAHAERNARASQVADRIRHARSLDDAKGPFDVVVANILRSVLLDFGAALVARLAPGATLVLSGLVSTDVPEVAASYARRLGGQRPEVYERGEWRTLVWRRAFPAHEK